MKLIFLLLVFSSLLHAAPIWLREFNYAATDIADRGFTKEELFKKMNHPLIRKSDSICSNRSLMWNYDFKTSLELDTPNIFLFYTPKTGNVGPVTWWYHVVPLVNEKGRFWAMDAGYPHRIKGPLPIDSWLKEWNGRDTVCKEIKEGEDDLVALMFKEQGFPENTRYGRYDCYYKITPGPYWTPNHLAQHLLGRDSAGRPVRLVRDDYKKDEVMEACIETSTSPIGWTWVPTLSKCRYFVYRGR